MADIRVQREQRLADLRKRQDELDKWREALTEVAADISDLYTLKTYRAHSTEIFKIIHRQLSGLEKRTIQSQEDVTRRIAVLQQAMHAAASHHAPPATVQLTELTELPTVQLTRHEEHTDETDPASIPY